MDSLAAGEAILIRADAGPNIGAGHLMRCLALAEAWENAGGRAGLASAELSTISEELARHFSSGVVRVPGGSPADAQATVQAARALHAKYVILDGYHFDGSYQQTIQREFRVLVIDDYAHTEAYCADIILNQNLPASAEMYGGKISGQTRLLLGPKYALLRGQFLRQANRERPVLPRARNILVTLGGADPHNVTTKIIAGLQLLDRADMDITIIVGAFNPHLETIRTAAKQLTGPSRVFSNASNMPELMHSADLAITGAGSTVLELAFMGVPMLAVTFAENQVAIARQVEHRELGTNLGWHEQVELQDIAQAVGRWIDDKAARERASQLGRSLVNGKGAERVCEVLGA